VHNKIKSTATREQKEKKDWATISFSIVKYLISRMGNLGGEREERVWEEKDRVAEISGEEGMSTSYGRKDETLRGTW